MRVRGCLLRTLCVMESPHKHVHSETDGSGVSYKAGDIPRFKHRAPKYPLPRYWTVLGVVWMTSVAFAVHDLVDSVHGPDIDKWEPWPFREALLWLCLMIAVSLLWKAWQREEENLELLPDDEYERRYPGSTGAEPAGERSQRGGRNPEPSHADPGIFVERER